MALTDKEKNNWILSNKYKIILCDIQYHDGTELKVGHFANYPYILKESDSFVWEFTNGTNTTIKNISYIDNLISIPTISSRIDSDFNIGSLEFLNAEGEYDNLIKYAWEGHPIKIYMGDPNWVKEDFILILEGVATKITSPNSNTMSLSIRDNKELLNVKVQDKLLNEEYISNLYSNYLTDTGNQPFVKNAYNALSTTNSIEININSNMKAEDICELVYQELRSLNVFNDDTGSFNDYTNPAINTHSGLLILSNSILGLGSTIADGDLDPNISAFDTNFLFNIKENNTIASKSGTSFTFDNAFVNVYNSYTSRGCWIQNHTFAGTPYEWCPFSYIDGHTGFTDPTTSPINWSSVYSQWQPGHAVTAWLGSRESTDPKFTDDLEKQYNFPAINSILFTDDYSKLDPVTNVYVDDESGVRNTLNSKYFRITTPTSSMYVWFNVEYTGTDPGFINSIPTPFGPNAIVIPETSIDTPIPIALGECFNITPLLIDQNNHVYQINDGPIEAVLEVRANGEPLRPETSFSAQYEVNLDIGCIRLLVHQQNAEITCDVIGVKSRASNYLPDINGIPYNIQIHSAAHFIEWLALEKAKLDPSVICLENFSNFPNKSKLGLYITEETEVATLVGEILSTVGAYSRFGRTKDCLLQIHRFEDPTDKIPILYLSEDSLIERGITLGETEVPKEAVNISYKKNWTIQNKASIAANIAESDSDEVIEKVEAYTNEYSKTISIYNENIKDIFPLAEISDTVNSLFVTKEDALEEANRRANILSKKRYIYKLETVNSPFTIELGDVINIKHRRYSFSGGINCLVIGIDEFPTKQRVDLEVWY